MARALVLFYRRVWLIAIHLLGALEDVRCSDLKRLNVREVLSYERQYIYSFIYYPRIVRCFTYSFLWRRFHIVEGVTEWGDERDDKDGYTSMLLNLSLSRAVCTDDRGSCLYLWITIIVYTSFKLKQMRVKGHEIQFTSMFNVNRKLRITLLSY